MKKAEDFKDEIFNLLYVDSDEDMQDVYKFIKIVQEDAIRETVEECANNAEINFNTNDDEFISDTDFSFRDGDGNWCKISINEDKIYSVADKLIKEL